MTNLTDPGPEGPNLTDLSGSGTLLLTFQFSKMNRVGADTALPAPGRNWDKDELFFHGSPVFICFHMLGDGDLNHTVMLIII